MHNKYTHLSLIDADHRVKHSYAFSLKIKNLIKKIIKYDFFSSSDRSHSESHVREDIPFSLYVVLRHAYYDDLQAGTNGKHRPSGFSYVKTMKNLVDTIEISKYARSVKLIVFYTGSEQELSRDVSMLPILNSTMNFEIKIVDGSSALDSWLIMLRYIRSSNINNEAFVYFLENDYIHDSYWLDAIVELINSGIDFNYINLYDHPDRYKFVANYAKTSLYATNSRHWICTPSACASFITCFKQFKMDFKHFYGCNHDDKIFRKLTGGFLRRKMLMPVPSLSTHSEFEHLAPVARLEEYFKKEA
jgi:hypothetical protein